MLLLSPSERATSAFALSCCIVCLVSIEYITANASSSSAPDGGFPPSIAEECRPDEARVSCHEGWCGSEEYCAAAAAVDIVGEKHGMDDGKHPEEEKEKENEDALLRLDDSADFNCIKLFVPSVIDEGDISLFPPLKLLSPSSSFILYEDCLLQVPNRFEDPEQLQAHERLRRYEEQLVEKSYLRHIIVIRNSAETWQIAESLFESKLSAIEYVTDAVIISRNQGLGSLEQLHLRALHEIGGVLEVGYNDHLQSLAGLESLSHVLFSVSIQSNQNLYNLTGLNSLESIGYESDYNLTLNRLSPKKSAQEDADHFRRHNEQRAQRHADVKAKQRSLWIKANSRLTSLDGLNNLRWVTGGINIAGNHVLTSIGSLAGLARVGLDLAIANNRELKDYHGLQLGYQFGPCGSIGAGHDAEIQTNCPHNSFCNYSVIAENDKHVGCSQSYDCGRGQATNSNDLRKDGNPTPSTTQTPYIYWCECLSGFSMDENSCKEIDETMQPQFLEGQQRQGHIANLVTAVTTYFSTTGQQWFLLQAIVLGVVQLGVVIALRRLYPKAYETIERQFGKMRLNQPPSRALGSYSRLKVSKKIIGTGAHSVVFEGTLAGRAVAVKRLNQHLYKTATAEIKALVRSDEHPNVVRCFAVEENNDFIDIVLELCPLSLLDCISRIRQLVGFIKFTDTWTSFVKEKDGSTVQEVFRNLRLLKSLILASNSTQSKTQGKAMRIESKRLQTEESRWQKGTHDLVISEAFPEELYTGEFTVSNFLRALMSDVCSGISYLHSVGIVHRDLKPQNVLISFAGRAKISDMGICRQMEGAPYALTSSWSFTGTATGSTGWKAPELLRLETSRDSAENDSSSNDFWKDSSNDSLGESCRLTPKVDCFALGCLLHYTYSLGRHPFGESPLEYDLNIIQNKFQIISDCPLGGEDMALSKLVMMLVAASPEERLSAAEAQIHIGLWCPDRRLKFLCKVSDYIDSQVKGSETQLRLEKLLEDCNTMKRSIQQSLVYRIPRHQNWSWKDKLDSVLQQELERFRKYNFNSFRALLRVIRNKATHYDEMSGSLQQILGSMPNGYLRYFTSRFPYLIIDTWTFAQQHLRDKEAFAEYFST